MSPEELRDASSAHAAALASPDGLVLYPTPKPTLAEFNPLVAALTQRLARIKSLDSELAAERAGRDAAVLALGAALTARAKDTELVSGGDAEKILKAGFQLQSTGSPTSFMPAPTGLLAKMGRKPGEMQLSCDSVPRAKMYVWECREHEDGKPPGPWTAVKIGSRSSIVAVGLVSGKFYAFRVKVLGPNDTESPWSDESVEMAR